MRTDRTIYMHDGRPAPELMTEQEAAAFLRLADLGIKNPGQTLRRYRDGGTLRATRISKQNLYSLSELMRFVEAQTEGTR